jgi:hypothetical protein
LFATQLLKLRLQNWKEILRNFVLGVVVLNYDLPHEVILLCFKLFRQRRLCLVIQEGKFDLMSLNLLYKGDLLIIFLSEVSASFFRQIIGRGGRVSCEKQGIGIVICQTPSGTIALPGPNETQICEDDLLSQRLDIGSIDDFIGQFKMVNSTLVEEIHWFLSSCRFNEKEHAFFVNLMTLFQAVLYNDAFKYCCSTNDVGAIMDFLSCVLIVQSGNDLALYRENVDGQLRKLALNSASKGNQYTKKTFDGIKTKFVQEAKRLFGNDLTSVFGFLRILQDGYFRFQDDASLARMFFRFRELTKLSDLMKRFLFNLQSGKSSQDLNRSINGLLTMLTSFDGVLDQLMKMIMSSSIDSDTFQRVGDDRTYGERVDIHQQRPIEYEDTFSTLMSELRAGPKSLEFLANCLSKYSKSVCVKCASVWNQFKPFICGHMKLILESARKDYSACRLAITKLELELRVLEETIQCNSKSLKGVKLTRANRPLIDEKTSKLAELDYKKSEQDRFEFQIQSWEDELAPYHGLSEEDTVCLFIEQIGQSQSQ